ncbi:hypothetical protein [Mesorhizobium sp. CAU 1741]|uniref:hypothetical protein n=1 Tax=Mesorhizobium sp. CAU 1741 TaxID=3140366 RepID=UPI00325B208C
MFKFIKTVALSALIGISAFAAMPATAQAQSGGIYLGFGSQGPSIGVQFHDRDRDRDRRHGFRRDRDRGCSAREAVNKAERMGLRRARVIGENRRVLRVAGRARGHGPATIVFANARNCPVIR